MNDRHFWVLGLRWVPWGKGTRSVQWIGSITPSGDRWEATITCSPMDSNRETDRIVIERETFDDLEAARAWCHAQGKDTEEARAALMRAQMHGAK